MVRTARNPQRLRTYWPLSAVVRTTGDPSSVTASVRRIVHDLKPDVRGGRAPAPAVSS